MRSAKAIPNWCALLVTALALVLISGSPARGLPEQYLTVKMPDEPPMQYLGWAKSKTSFETCSHKHIQIGSGEITPAREKCKDQPPPTYSMNHLHLRDPFQIETQHEAGAMAGSEASLPAGVLPQGERGLVISRLKLEGTVHALKSNVMIAVVTNETGRAYFLHENESLYNGVVSKITSDAVYFKENVLDVNGRVTSREVVKRLGSAPGEGR